MADLFQIGLSGIYSSQAKLSTTSHNIANISTEGYSRQSVVSETAGAERYGDYFIGTGSIVAGVERAYDQFAFTENNLNTSNLGYATETYEQNNQMDMLLSDESTSITQPVLEVFESISGVADNPNMLESRTVFLESAGNMVSQYNRLYENLEIQYSNINNDIVNSAQTINQLADNISSLNQQISSLLGSGNASNTNDLFDQRDKAINELSEFVDVSAVTTDNGMMNVYIGSGQALVMGSDVLTLTTVNGDPDPARKELALTNGDHISLINGERLGGKLSALFETRNNDLERAFNQIGQNVIGLTHSINEQQKEGLTLEGEIGTDLFNDVNSQDSMESRVLAHNDGLGEALLTVRIDDLSSLTADEFDLVVDDYQVATASSPETITFTSTNRTTGETSTSTVDMSVSQRLEIPNSGISVGIDSITSLSAGKEFTLRPTRLAAQEVTLQHKDVAKVVTADSEIKTVASSDNTGTAVLRTNSILGNTLDLGEDNLFVTINITAIDATTGEVSYDVLDTNGTAISSLSGTTTPDLLTGKATFAFAGVEVEMISGSLATNDTFTLNYNETGDGDNRNIMKMADLQTQKIMNNNKATFADVYNGMLSEVGAKTANADISMQSATILQSQSYDRIQALSGVNMDEEVANLLQFQQHYSVATRVISVASELFDTILQVAR
ncbi:flagellar hook-associated protein FlgK [Psychromonas sp. KJ10-10]|uniref:flagellar hook-associated protein FlgK n=1 Tax=Psychromonas sp. KJ10-10 TaxID=3391823 RepID=UPI0039B4302B